MSWLKKGWEGRIVQTLYVLPQHSVINRILTGVVVHDHAVRGRPIHVHRYVDVLWDSGEIEEEVHTSGLEVISEK